MSEFHRVSKRFRFSCIMKLTRQVYRLFEWKMKNDVHANEERMSIVDVCILDESSLHSRFSLILHFTFVWLQQTNVHLHFRLVCDPKNCYSNPWIKQTWQNQLTTAVKIKSEMNTVNNGVMRIQCHDTFIYSLRQINSTIPIDLRLAR